MTLDSVLRRNDVPGGILVPDIFDLALYGGFTQPLVSVSEFTPSMN